jgi:hypothetical protein
MTFVPGVRPVKAAFIGLGRIYDLNVRAYAGNPDVEVVALRKLRAAAGSGEIGEVCGYPGPAVVER